MDELSPWLEAVLGLDAAQQQKLAWSLAVLGGLWLARSLILRLVERRTDDVRVRYRWKKVSIYLAVALGVLGVTRIWIGTLHAASTYLGLLSAGLAIALKDPLVNLAGWLFILWRRPFKVGDRIQIGATSGDVIDVRIFQFTVLEIGNWVQADQSTGRIVHVPNGQVFLQRLANSTSGFAFLWNELPVLVTFESDWRRAKEILQEIADRHTHHLSEEAQQQVRRAAEKFMIFYSKLTPKVYTSVEDSGVLLTIRYLCNARRRRGSAEAIWEDILDRFAECDNIDFAYPTQRFYDNPREGKPGTLPPASGPTHSGPT
ncbi:MAG: mechanosensitive ion channel family protein [Acidobacteriota bacterium]